MAADSTNDLNHAVLNLTEQEKRAFSYLFAQADSDSLGVVTGERAVAFFERTKVSPDVLGAIWQIADTENRGLLTKPGFCMVLRLIGHYQAGREPSTELAFKPGPVPKFEGLQIPGVGPPMPPRSGPASPTIGGFPANALQPQSSGNQGASRVPLLDAQKVQHYSGLFDRAGAQNGLLNGVAAKNIFERAGLPNEVLGKIWNLSDRQKRGELDQSEFIVAMHLLMSIKSGAMTAVPNTLPAGLYEAAARRGPPPPGNRGSLSSVGPSRQFTGPAIGAPPRTQSPLARSAAGFGAPPTLPAQMTGTPWLVTAQEKIKYDQFFAGIDTPGRGIITGEQAVSFFSDSRLPEDTLATIWDLADINSEGQLNKDQFAVAMYLIKQQRAPNSPPLPAFLPPALVPPSMRQQTQQAQSTAPAFDNANNATLPKSAADDLFGLDEPMAPQPAQPSQGPTFQAQPVLQPQTTGTSASRDPFGGSLPSSPSSPQQRFQSQPQQSSTMFKPFLPTSAFGAALTQQNTGGSLPSSQRGFAPQQAAQPSQPHPATAANDDLLGDNDTHAAESSNISNDTTELANMSSQIGNLRSQMETTQTKKAATQADLTATQNQKRDIELRLQQFRTQYETEVRAVKELETQLAASRDSTKKLGQELAMLEGTHQDLQSQHGQVSQQLQADQSENATLKQRIGELNAEVARLKPEIERMKLEARQQKGLVSINRKQMTTNEGERDRLQSERAGLERGTAEREETAGNAPSEPESHYGHDAAFGAAGLGAVGAAAFGTYEATRDRQPSGQGAKSPSASSTLSHTNPFFRKASEGPSSPPVTSPSGTGPTPSAFDSLFGPSAAFSNNSQADGRLSTPPPTSFGRGAATSDPAPPNMTGSVQSVSSAGEPTPSATPPVSDQAKDSPIDAADAVPPPPPENRQFQPSQLPVVALPDRPRAFSEASSTRVMPPASRAGGVETPRELDEAPAPDRGIEQAVQQAEHLPGAFPDEAETATAAREVPAEESGPLQPQARNVNDDFDSAFAGFGGAEKTRDAPDDGTDPFAPVKDDTEHQPAAVGQGGRPSEFPPIQSLESEDEQSSDEEDNARGDHRNFGNSFMEATTSPPPVGHSIAELSPATTRESAQTVRPIAEGATTTSVAEDRPVARSMESTASTLPTAGAQSSPPSYELSNEPSHGGPGDTAGSLPREFDGLLPAREDPTSPSAVPEQAEQGSSSSIHEKENSHAPPERSATGSSSLYPNTMPQTPSTTDVFVDANSRPVSSMMTSASPATAQQAPRNAFDEFDEFDDLAEAKEDKAGSDFDFGGFGSSSTGPSGDGFNSAFESPAASMTNTMASSQQTPRGDSYAGYHNHSGAGTGPFDSMASSNTNGLAPTSSIQNTPQNTQHDWDAIFSGLDNNKNIDTSLPGASTSRAVEDPWSVVGGGANSEREEPPIGPAPPPSLPAPRNSSRPQQDKAKQIGRAITPGTEHDDPILKRLTGMGYPRTEALGALEMYDYDINKAVDHLTGK
ncbi:hypothetical protein LTR62_007701 [Meristemomyces frigidus]|uniref:Uncharacterized protein n=1 Tax=Meristemomyces frigidus TaxID=1508187 RepID=A0AAN7TAB2_9PEZI|nr:hypothetical protein LTR62_007701 [Meristemomyces frigidus]